MKPYTSLEEFQRRLAILSNVEATKELARYYIHARFRLSKDDFESRYCDGKNDGGIDFFFQEDGTYFIFQSKYVNAKSKTSESEVTAELNKIEKTLTKTNPNTRAATFVNELKTDLSNKASTLEIVWLTTKNFPEGVFETAQEQCDRMRKSNGWKIPIDFVPVDLDNLRTVIQDVLHGNVPYTGKKKISIEANQFIEFCDETTGVRCVIVSVGIVDLLKWFGRSEVQNFLQKNVRGFMGENDVNKGIKKSFREQPEWFWYKHNGIIIFVDNFVLDADKGELTLRNPQIVNGGQTARSLFSEWDRTGRPQNSSAKVLIRVYRLPYESSEAYERGIEIISALNSQTKIYVSDLRSMDPRQVRIEEMVSQVGGYRYHRRRGKEFRATRYGITMRDLALLYYIVKKRAPHYGTSGELEQIFKEKNRYNEVFNETEINKELTINHVVVKFVTVWVLDQILGNLDIPARDDEFKAYTQFCVLTDTYCKLDDWRKSQFELGWHEWVEFIDSEQFKLAVSKYGKAGFRIGREIIPKRQEARKYFRTADAYEKYLQNVSQRFFTGTIRKAYSGFCREHEYA
jgi:hypothetical protein